MQLALRRAQPSESRELREWIKARHYTKTAPPGYVLALEFLEQNGHGQRRVGAMLLGRPTSRELPADRWFELTRMFFVDEAPPNTESRALALMRRHVRTWHPAIRGLLAYSDPSVGHGGTVYQADGWACFGRTRNSRHGWRTRPGRNAPEGAPSRKVRWVRTP